MKRVLLLLLAGVLSVGLAACGGGFAGYDPETTAQALLDSGAFEDALDTLDEESACMVYGLDPPPVRAARGGAGGSEKGLPSGISQPSG